MKSNSDFLFSHLTQIIRDGFVNVNALGTRQRILYINEFEKKIFIKFKIL